MHKLNTHNISTLQQQTTGQYRTLLFAITQITNKSTTMQLRDTANSYLDNFKNNEHTTMSWF